jgi:hypothetical protein
MLKGLTATLGMKPISDVFAEFETAFKNEQCTMDDVCISEAFLIEYQRAIDMIKGFCQQLNSPAKDTVEMLDWADLKAVLVELCEEGSGESFITFDEHEQHIKARLEPDEFEQLKQAINNFEFDEALLILQRN